MIDFKVEQSNGVEVLVVEGDLTIRHANELKAILMKSLNGLDLLALNFEKATEVDLSCLQLLCSAHRTAVRSGRRLILTRDRSEALKRAIEDAGYSRQRGCVLDRDSSCFWKACED